MSAAPLATIELETGPGPEATVILLHGLGADGNDFVPIVDELHLPEHLHVRFVFPHAPVRRVTVNGGMAMRAWYDIASGDLHGRADLAGVRESQAQVEALLARETARGIPASRTILAGFSQGGAIALYAGLRFPERLAGIVALSAYLIAGERLEEERAGANRDVPIFMAHGTADPVVRFEWGDDSRRLLERLGYRVEWRRYDMEHTVTRAVIADLSRYISDVFVPGSLSRQDRG